MALGKLDFLALSPDPNLNPSLSTPHVGYSGGGGNFSLKPKKDEKALSELKNAINSLNCSDEDKLQLMKVMTGQL